MESVGKTIAVPVREMMGLSNTQGLMLLGALAAFVLLSAIENGYSIDVDLSSKRFSLRSTVPTA